MLALTRKCNDAIIIDGNIEIKILEIQGDKVKIGIAAPKEVGIYRKEIYVQMEKSNQEATQTETVSFVELNELLKNI